MDEYLSLLQLFIFLPLILLAAYFGIRYAGRFLNLPCGRPGTIRVVERLSIDTRNALYLVKCSEYYLLVGIGPSGFTLLKEIPAGELEENLPDQVGTGSGSNMGESFQKLLQRLRGTEGAGDDEI